MDELGDAVLIACSGDEVLISNVADDERCVDNCLTASEFERIQHHDIATGCAERPDGV